MKTKRMDRERKIREGTSLSTTRERRNLREKERRMRMKHLFFLLSSLVSPNHRKQLSVPQLIDQATAYMIQMKEKVNYLKEKKRELLRGEVGNCSEGISSILPKLTIHSWDSTIQMNLIMDLNMKKVMLHELVNVFEEEGAQVMSVNLQNLNDRVTCTIIAQAITCWIGIDPTRIEERIRHIIF